MSIAEVIKFEGPQDALVWKYPIEDFNATSQLIVDETHEALLVVNGNAADLFTAGRRTLSTPNIPIARKIIEIPTGGDSPFPCKIFFINKVHQMDLLWGTQGPIALEDPVYNIFMHVMSNGSMSISVSDSRKFMLKMVGFRDRFNPQDFVSKFRGIISSHVKDCISNIMIKGLLSYFTVNANLFELSGVIKERLDVIFEEYGVHIEYFNIETIEVPESDYKKISEAKERRTGRMIEGYTWQEERQMTIAEKFASNQGNMSETGGALSGLMMASAMGSSIADIARNALNPNHKLSENINAVMTEKPQVQSQAQHSEESVSVSAEKKINSCDICAGCGSELPENAKFCLNCGEKVQKTDPDKILCPECGNVVVKGKFCLECGHKFSNNCSNCGVTLPDGAKFCLECGQKV